MSVRIYQLSKDLGVENSELIHLLRKRGHDVRSASSTIDNISAESLLKEFSKEAVATREGAGDGSEGVRPTPSGSSLPDVPPAPTRPEPPVPPKPPAGALVRSREDIERERREREEEARKAAMKRLPPPIVASPPKPNLPNRPPSPGKQPGMVAPPRVVRPPQPGQRGIPGGRGTAPQSFRIPVPPAKEAAPNTPPTAPASEQASGSGSSSQTSTAFPAKSPPQGNRPPATPSPSSINIPVLTERKPSAPSQPQPVSPKPAPATPSPLRQVSPPAVSSPRPPAPPPLVPTKEPNRPPAIPEVKAASTSAAPPLPGRPGTPPAIPSAKISPERSSPQAASEGNTVGSTPATPAESPPLRKLQIRPPIIVRDFAVQIGRKPFQLISELMEMNIFASMNQVIEDETAKRIAARHGFELDIHRRGETQAEPAKPKVEKPKPTAKAEPRPPVVCILGHVDHGKTTLLDTIRKANVVAGEAGGITQHIGAYQIEYEGRKITFIDTPGHAAFSNMRARGANVTDIAILVVAADDGFMPQTDEALEHARKAGVPIVVAINKTDMPGANIDRVKRQMQERNLSPEDWGGETLSAAVSALKGTGVNDLLESILLQAEVTEGIEAVAKGPARGIIIETQKETGLGSTASAIITEGELKKGDALICGPNWCKVRTILDDKGKPLKSATPSTPVKIIGWDSLPSAGDEFDSVKNDREAKALAEENAYELKKKELAAEQISDGPATLEDLFAAIERNQKRTYRCIVKADVYGTAEALAFSLAKIVSDKIDIRVLDMGVGSVNKADIDLASAANASIIGFNVGLENGVAALAKHQSVRIHQQRIIYELIDEVKDAMADLLEPELRENKTGAAEVRAVFPVSKGFVAGCMVTEGRINRGFKARLLRKDKVIFEGRIGQLKRFKDDATEVRAGYECGIQVDGFNDYKEGDIIETHEVLKIKAKL